MFKGKVFILLLVLFLLSISYSESLATPPLPPHPICAISATVLNIKKTKEEIVFDKPHSYVDYYAVRLKIHNSSVIRQSELGVSCDKLIDTEKDSILTLSEYDKFSIKIGQEVYANIHFGGDERLGGYFLSDIKILR